MTLPAVDIDELNLWKEENFKERLQFIAAYVAWIKQQKNF